MEEASCAQAPLGKQNWVDFMIGHESQAMSCLILKCATPAFFPFRNGVIKDILILSDAIEIFGTKQLIVY